MLNKLKKFKRDMRGAVTVLVTLLLIPALLVTGTGVDIATMFAARSVVRNSNELALERQRGRFFLSTVPVVFPFIYTIKNRRDLCVSIINWLEEWYVSNCDGDWEHTFGITINTIDNPGWSRMTKGTVLFDLNFWISFPFTATSQPYRYDFWNDKRDSSF